MHLAGEGYDTMAENGSAPDEAGDIFDVDACAGQVFGGSSGRIYCFASELYEGSYEFDDPVFVEY